ncbi:MAG: TRAP transporter substrate-binding protein [Clostridiales bacterium]|nr:TRAP transporter substrate-binding protein [Clostridiales bacterium]
MKRKATILLASALLTLSLAGCGESASVENKSSAETSGSSDSSKAAEEGFQITLGNGLVETLPTPQACNKFKELVESQSEGQISVEVYHNQQLGGDRELVEATQMNNVQMCPPSSTPYCNFVSEFYVWDVPFLFKDYDQVQKMYDNTELLEKYNQISIEKAGIRVLSYWMNGFRNVTCNGERRTPDDFKGMKIRTMENDLHLATWKAIGANPTPMAFGEVYTALQQKTIDAQENPNNTNYETKYYEVCDSCIQTKHIYTPYPLLINESFYQSLPDNLQQIVSDAANEAGDFEIELSISRDEEYKEKLQEAGCSVIELTEEERQLFVDKVTSGGIQEMAKEKSGNPELSEEFFKAVNEL